jgi:hypothetical protein
MSCPSNTINALVRWYMRFWVLMSDLFWLLMCYRWWVKSFYTMLYTIDTIPLKSSSWPCDRFIIIIITTI